MWYRCSWCHLDINTLCFVKRKDDQDQISVCSTGVSLCVLSSTVKDSECAALGRLNHKRFAVFSSKKTSGNAMLGKPFTFQILCQQRCLKRKYIASSSAQTTPKEIQQLFIFTGQKAVKMTACLSSLNTSLPYIQLKESSGPHEQGSLQKIAEKKRRL